MLIADELLDFAAETFITLGGHKRLGMTLDKFIEWRAFRHGWEIRGELKGKRQIAKGKSEKPKTKGVNQW